MLIDMINPATGVDLLPLEVVIPAGAALAVLIILIVTGRKKKK